MTRVKICGLTRRQDVEWAIECGADALGFIFDRSSPRFVGNNSELLQSVASSVGPWHPPLVGVARRLTKNIPHMDFHQAESFGKETWLGQILVLRPEPAMTRKKIITRLRAVGPWATLVDAYHPSMPGGTGRRVDLGFFELVREVLAGLEEDFVVSRALILAGGLTPENVSDAIQKTRPYAVDVSSGVEASPGIKDPIKVRDFIQAAKTSL